MKHVRQPGPPNAERIELASVEGEAITVTLPAGIPLEDAVAEALDRFDAGWLELRHAPVSTLCYVIPALSDGPEHAAWYSDTYRFPGTGRIDHLGMIVGRLNGASFLHGHGLWTPDSGAQAAGHILAPHTVLAEPTQATGFGLRGATFDRLPDAETNFTLFRVADRQAETRFALCRLAPNHGFVDALKTACARLGWGRARAHGLGSFIDTVMADGQALNSLPSEFLILDATSDAAPDVVIVGTDPARILRGRVADDAAVLITVELVLERLD